VSELTLLAQATRALGGTLDLGRLMGRLTELAQDHLGADAAGVWLFERGGAELVLRGDVGFKRPEVVARLAHPPGRDVLGWISARPGPIILRRLPAEARPEARRWLEGEEVRSFAGVPLLGDAAPLGALGLFRRSSRPFTRVDLGLVETLCLPAAPAILNARLYAEQLGRAERTEILLATAEALGATLDLPAALADLSQRAARALDAEHCAITLWPDARVPADAALGEAEAARHRRPVEVDDTSLVVPILRQGEAIGVLRLTARARRRWERSAVDLAGAIAGQIVLVAENARLYREAQAQAAAALQRAEELAALQRKLIHGETLRALGELAGGAAHHLNNLLTIVVGRIQLLRRMVEEERLARPLEIIERAAKDGAEVVRRLQQFAGMRRTAEPEAVDLGQIITDVLEMTRGRWQDPARAQGTEITVESRAAPLPPLPGDAAALRELLTNLVLNAVDALPRGGRLTVEAAPIDDHVVVSVSDTGIGMAEEVRQRAHEPFFTTKGVKTTGLGLSVAFGIARRHGGELTIQSEEGRGTTIRVTLPLPPVPR
jgi:signal transduction histidine kinase